MAGKKIGIGYENYKEFIDQDLYYIDKTTMIHDIIAYGGKVTAKEIRQTHDAIDCR